MSHWYIQDELAADTSWSQQSSYATWQNWLAPTNAGFLEASEDPFDLNVKPEDLDVKPEDMQAGETDWSTEKEPTHSWTDQDEDDYEDWWYAKAAPAYFYWDGESDLDDPGDTLWYPISESRLDFYQISIVEASGVSWTNFYFAPADQRFYIEPEDLGDFWYIIAEPEDEI